MDKDCEYRMLQPDKDERVRDCASRYILSNWRVQQRLPLLTEYAKTVHKPTAQRENTGN